MPYQARALMQMVTMLMKCIDRLETLTPYLEKLGKLTITRFSKQHIFCERYTLLITNTGIRQLLMASFIFIHRIKHFFSETDAQLSKKGVSFYICAILTDSQQEYPT